MGRSIREPLQCQPLWGPTVPPSPQVGFLPAGSFHGYGVFRGHTSECRCSLRHNEVQETPTASQLHSGEHLPSRLHFRHFSVSQVFVSALRGYYFLGPTLCALEAAMGATAGKTESLQTLNGIDFALLKINVLMVSMVPWRTFDIHGTFPIHKTHFIAENKIQIKFFGTFIFKSVRSDQCADDCLVLTGLVTGWSLAVLAFERYVVICKPFGSFKFGQNQAFGAVAFTWFMGASCATPPFWGWSRWNTFCLLNILKQALLIIFILVIHLKDWLNLHDYLQIHSWGSRHCLRTWLVHKKRGVQFRELHLLPHSHLLLHANEHHHLLLLAAARSPACCEYPNSLLL